MFHAKHLHHDNLFPRNANDRWYRGLEKLCSTLSHCFSWMWHEELRFYEDPIKNLLDSNIAATMSPFLLLFIVYPLGNQFWTHSSRKIALRLLQFKNAKSSVCLVTRKTWPSERPPLHWMQFSFLFSWVCHYSWVI